MSWLYLSFHTFGINLPWMLFPGSAVNRLQPKDSCELHDIPLNLGQVSDEEYSHYVEQEIPF